MKKPNFLTTPLIIMVIIASIISPVFSITEPLIYDDFKSATGTDPLHANWKMYGHGISKVTTSGIGYLTITNGTDATGVISNKTGFIATTGTYIFRAYPTIGESKWGIANSESSPTQYAIFYCQSDGKILAETNDGTSPDSHQVAANRGTDYRIYRIDWTLDYVNFYIDGVDIYQSSIAPHTNLQLILKAENTVPSKLKVDYVSIGIVLGQIVIPTSYYTTVSTIPQTLISTSTLITTVSSTSISPTITLSTTQTTTILSPTVTIPATTTRTEVIYETTYTTTSLSTVSRITSTNTSTILMTSYVATGTATQVVVNYVTSTIMTTSTSEIFGGSNFTTILAAIAGVAAIAVAIVVGRQILKKPKPPPPKPPEAKPAPTPTPPTPPPGAPTIPIALRPPPKVVSLTPLPRPIGPLTKPPTKPPAPTPATIEKAIETIGPEVRDLEQKRVKVLTTLKTIDTQLALLGKKVSDSIKKAETPIKPEVPKPKKPKVRAPSSKEDATPG